MTSEHAYADRLSTHGYKGKLDLPQLPDPPLAVLHKSRFLADCIRNASHVVVHTGAGISTSAGINDFRGPNGVWTTQRKRAKRPRTSVIAETAPDAHSHVTFDNAVPTLTHMALVGLHKASHVHYVISQNVDCLHLRSGLPRQALSELHGNLFIEWCAHCRREVILDSQTETVGMNPTSSICDCGRPMTDKALDWDDVLPEPDFELAKKHSAAADFNLVLGTSCQMEPARSLHFRGAGGKKSRAIVNLSRTDFDDRFGICIRAYCDTVFAIIAVELGVRIPPFERLVKLVLSVRWVDRGVHYRVTSANGLVKYDMQVRHRCADGDSKQKMWSDYVSEFPHNATIPTTGRHIEAEVETKKGKLRLEATAERRKLTKAEGEIVVEQKDWEARGAEIIKELNNRILNDGKSRKPQQSADSNVWFVAGMRRGWSVCCLCRKEIWCGQNRRYEHMKACAASFKRFER
ncbi:unnamed protein product [Agarophyton chilense]|eukprot:gb/GEZJ01006197.1/.p1 GENE.gb/GEZJ01006197.1/~~gb/GEZJ01006197.1/.p1  ORF type:complete len:462 (-),score=50.00 gb/GEZJ01006197.1/:642-2027(-)